MKKTLIALAAVAATGAAFAQSSVTLDGVVELGVVNPAGANTPTRLDAANGASQIRFRGTEDLGGGLKANFVLAQRLSLESGGNDGTANGRPTFQGESTVGLSGGFGSIENWSRADRAARPHQRHRPMGHPAASFDGHPAIGLLHRANRQR